MNGTFKKALIKIALAEHAPSCKMKSAPIDECPCYRPAELASKALGIRSPWDRSDSEHARLLEGRVPNDEPGRPVDVAAMAKELPFSAEEIEQARVYLKLAIEAAVLLASSHNMTLEYAAHRIGRMIKAGVVDHNAVLRSDDDTVDLGSPPPSITEQVALDIDREVVSDLPQVVGAPVEFRTPAGKLMATARVASVEVKELQAEVEQLRKAVADSAMMLEQDQRRIDTLTRTGQRVVAERNNLRAQLKGNK